MTTWSDRILLDLHHASMVLMLYYLNSIGEALRDDPLGLKLNEKF